MSQTDPAWCISVNSLTLDKLGSLSLEIRIEGYSNSDILTGVRISQRFLPLDGGETFTKLLYV